MKTQKLTRRHFLQTTAAAAAPFILPSRIWSAETKPNDRITIGCIGMGKQAHGLLDGFLKQPGTQVVAVCDVDKTRREEGKRIVEEDYTKKHGKEWGFYKGCDIYNDFRELLARKDIDAVVIATPDHWHALIAIAAANAGKDIYCEKPLTETVHEAQALVAAVKKNKRIFQVGSMQRSSKEFRYACELVRAGKLGKISRVEAGFGGPGKPCDLPEEAAEPGLDWDRWLGPAPMRPYNSILSPRGVHNHFPAWRNYWEYGGGMVTDWGAHHLDITQWGLGADDSGPVKIVPPEDWKTAQSGGKLIYADGVEVTHVTENGVRFFGSDGELFVTRRKFKLTLGGKVVAESKEAPKDSKEKPPEAKDVAEKIAKEILGDAKPLLYASDEHKADFLNAIKTRKDPICPVTVGAHSVIACHLLNFAYRYRQKIEWDPKTIAFKNDTGNAKWLTREYRGEWKIA
jgi:predicted dehydrogenase